MKKYIQVILLITSVILLGISVNIHMLSTKIQTVENEIEKYETEKTSIKFSIRGTSSSLSDYGYYPSSKNYEQIYSQLNNLYTNISNSLYVKKSSLDYFLSVNINGIGYKMASETEKPFISEGSWFSNEDIYKANNVVVISENFVDEQGNKIEIGDEIEVKNTGLGTLEPIRLKVIGKFQYYIGEIIYIPQTTLFKIEDSWKQQADELYDNNDRYYFLPMGIENPVFECEYEKDYQLLLDYIDDQMKTIGVGYEISRYYLAEKYFPDMTPLKEKIKNNIYLILAIFLVDLIIIVVIYKVQKNKEKEYEKLVLEKEAEHALHMMEMNKETHKLKHDMRHLLNHIYVLIEQQNYQDALQVIKEYQNEIEILNIPVYTNNKVINALMNIYLDKAQKENYDFSYSGQLDLEFNLSDRKLFLLLSNALENAFVHNNHLKKIQIKIDEVHRYYRIIIINTTDLKNISNTTNSSNKNHGHGLKSMNQIVEEENGMIKNEIQDGYYKCVILLPNTNVPKIIPNA